MRCGWTARPPRGCRHYSRDTRYWTAARRCAGRTAPCSWMAGAAAGRCSAGPSSRVSSRRWTALGRYELERVRLDERLGAERAQLVDVEAQQEAAREQRVRWQVEAAQVEAPLGAARERAGRATAEAEAARTQAAELRQEIAASEHDAAALDAQRAQWEDQLKERRLALAALEAAAVDAEEQVRGAEAELVRAEGSRDTAREALEAVGQEEHHLELERTGIEGRRRALAERVAVEWRKPLGRLLVEAPEVPGDVAWLRQEDGRLQAAIEAVGPVNALAVEEHAEETQRLEFLMAQPVLPSRLV